MKKSCVNLCITVSAVSVDFLKVKGYSLNVSAISRYIFFLSLKELAIGLAKGLLSSGTFLGIIS